ncbi:hypothetical protein I79_008124 [Cricetulus griseus]|uniref:Uncharacterized protein n=1 Tax=Cricetulus griseus TaxID=10029 RepID=G3HCB7_CRIGR|nr:hypothetical protein I79_008124 [Cricetulus griseus]
MKTKPSTVHSACKIRSSATENQPQHTRGWLGPVLPSRHLSLFPQVPSALLFVLCPGCSPPSANTSTPQTMCGYQGMEDSKAALVHS